MLIILKYLHFKLGTRLVFNADSHLGSKRGGGNLSSCFIVCL